jgi:hypothetical protein
MDRRDHAMDLAVFGFQRGLAGQQMLAIDFNPATSGCKALVFQSAFCGFHLL